MILNKKQMTEEDIKLQYITPAIQAKWGLDRITMETKITDGRINLKGNIVTREKPKKADYVLYLTNNKPIAIVEAKDNNHSISYGLQQAITYAKIQDIPFAYSSNGDGFQEHDLLTGLERTLSMDDFPTVEELTMRWETESNGGKGISANEKKVIGQPYYSSQNTYDPRYYQRNAINKTVEAIARGENRLLLVMATGTGKTYTAFQIVYRLLKCGLKKKVLYLADRNILVDESIKNASLKPKENFISKIVGIKRSVGMHPVGIMVIPRDMNFEDFTPLNQNFAPRSTTHFDFHSLHNTILKQDILGHSTLDLLLELEKRTGKSVGDIKWNDPLIYEMFQKADTLCIPEFETDFIRDMLIKTKPQNFNDLVKISGLCHGTNVWTDNAESLINDNVCSISEVIATRDDILVYLTGKGMDKYTAFRIMESVRKGLWAKQKLSDWDKKYFVEEILKINVPKWYIESLSKIRYMFPKAHATAYVMNAVRLMWFKIYYPEEFKKALEKIED